jgi:hypothetical protein
MSEDDPPEIDDSPDVDETWIASSSTVRLSILE